MTVLTISLRILSLLELPSSTILLWLFATVGVMTLAMGLVKRVSRACSRLKNRLTPSKRLNVCEVHPVVFPLIASTAATAPPVPKRKLFLSWAAVHRAVSTRAVTMEELDQCLFCTSIGELNLAEEFDLGWFERLHPALSKARKEGRLICSENRERLNDVETWQINALLKANGIAPLSCVDQFGTLDQIPIYSCVPSVSDGSLEVLWAAHPLRGDWRRAWGRTLEEIDDAFAHEPDEPEGPRANWMEELNRPIIEEARRKFEKPCQGNDLSAADSENGSLAGGDVDEGDGDPADYWKKGRPQDEE